MATPQRIRFGQMPRRTPPVTATKALQDIEHILPAKKMKSMAELDREEEARLARSYQDKANKESRKAACNQEFFNWFVRKLKSK
ncbi:hypothetical protein ACN47E_006647 [Coniothyrium glycines]